MNSKVVQIAIASAKVGNFSENTIFFQKKSSDSYKFSLDLYHFLLFFLSLHPRRIKIYYNN